jgi:hypothetical protein
VADAPQHVERKVAELSDWLVDSDFRQWQAVTDHLADRRREHRDRIVGDATAQGFHYDRTRLIDSVGREAQRVVETYDKSGEARALAESARNAVATSAAVGVGAVGLGTIVTVAATTAAADVTGIVMASVVAAIGFFILPNKRRRAKEEMREKVAAMRENLTRALRDEFEREIENSRHRISEGIAPYSRFVRAEHEKLGTMRTTLETAKRDIDTLRARIEAPALKPAR